MAEHEWNLNKIVVLKFGGTSVGNARAIERMANIVADCREEGYLPVVVLSAMNGTTNHLLRSELDVVEENHFAAASDLHLPHPYADRVKEELEYLFCQLKEEEGENPEAVDRRLSYGERLIVRMAKWKFVSMGTTAQAVDATAIIKTDDTFGEARPDFKISAALSRRIIYPLLSQGILPVVTGFIGSTYDGRTTTLGRGGSDYTASLLARFLRVKRVLIYTDVDGIFTKDPNVYPDARLIGEMSFKESDRKAKNGEKVLYPKTVEPLMDTGTELWVKNTFNLSCPGTRISHLRGAPSAF